MDPEAASDLTKEMLQSFLVERVRCHYPDLHTSVYRLPPVHFNRVPYSEDRVEDVPVLVVRDVSDQVSFPQNTTGQPPVGQNDTGRRLAARVASGQVYCRENATNSFAEAARDDNCAAGGLCIPPGRPRNVQHSDVREDRAQSLILDRLEQLAKDRRETVFLLSHLGFEHYLNKCYPGLGEVRNFYRAKGFPLAADLNGSKYGDFDVILIHRDHGIVIGEIKSLGFNYVNLSLDSNLPSDIIKGKLQQAVKQMEKCLKVAKHLVSDLTSTPPVRVALMIPFVRRSQLQQAVREMKPEQRKAFRNAVEAEDDNQAIGLCLCADEFDDNTKHGHSLTPLEQWLQQMQAHLGRCQLKMTPSLYEDVVARFCGPATTVAVHGIFSPRLELRTRAEAVAELAHRLHMLVLTPRQLSILRSSHATCVLSGPPGTGKSLLLVLKGLMSYCAGHDVHVVSTRPGSLAASYMIKQQIEVTLRHVGRHGVPELHMFDIYNNDDAYMEKSVQKMLACLPRDSEALVIMDELGSSSDSRRYKIFINRLLSEAPRLRLWAASMSHENLPPLLLEERLELQLRCPVRVQQEVERGLSLLTDVGRYGSTATPTHCDGVEVKLLNHSGTGHEGRWAWQCPQCGRDIAQSLRQLRVGSTEGLQYRDVLVLTRADLPGEQGLLPSPIGVVAGLRAEAIPVKVVGQWSAQDPNWMEEVRRTALALEDKVTVSHYGFVRGLERKIVVYMPGRIAGHDDDIADMKLDARSRVWAMSRCTAQLIIINTHTER